MNRYRIVAPGTESSNPRFREVVLESALILLHRVIEAEGSVTITRQEWDAYQDAKTRIGVALHRESEDEFTLINVLPMAGPGSGRVQ